MNNKFDKQQMFIDNDKLIYLTMKKYFPHLYSNSNVREDYYQIGAVGLLKAIERYDATKAAFSTYAVQMIWGEIKRNFRDKSNVVHYSRKVIDIANQLNSTYNSSEIDTDYEFWLTQELNKLDISYDEQLGVINYIFKPINLDTPTDNDEKLSIADSIASTLNVLDDVEYNSYIDNINNKLNEREKKIFKEYLSGDKQTVMGANNGISQAQVSRILKKVKCLAVKELYNAEYYDLASKLLYEMYENECDIEEICKKYQMNFQKIHNRYKENRINNMQELNIKNYSKKSCQKLILKCVMKLILKNKIPTADTFKQSVKKLLISNNYNNESVINHLEAMINSQIVSCIDLAKKTITKYNYNYEYEIVVDELDFNPSKLIKKEQCYDIRKIKPINNSKDMSCNNIIDNIISILEGFRRDNLMVRF